MSTTSTATAINETFHTVCSEIRDEIVHPSSKTKDSIQVVPEPDGLFMKSIYAYIAEKNAIIRKQEEEIRSLKAQLKLYQSPSPRRDASSFKKNWMVTPLSSTNRKLVWDDVKGKWIVPETI